MQEEKLLRKSLTETANNFPGMGENKSMTRQLNQNLSETIDALLKPEQTPEQIEPKLLVKKKREG